MVTTLADPETSSSAGKRRGQKPLIALTRAFVWGLTNGNEGSPEPDWRAVAAGPVPNSETEGTMFSAKLRLPAALFLALGFGLTSARLFAADSDKTLDIKWTEGPVTFSLKDIAEIKVAAGYRIADGKNTRTLLQAMGNPTSGTELGLLTTTNMGWFVVFRFNASGYVKDDDKDKLDPAGMLQSIREGTEQSNKEREKMGAAPMTIIGWEQAPKYNPETHNLEWAIRGESEGRPVINYNTRLLGRKGVMEVKLVVGPDKLADTMGDYQTVLQNYNFKQGERYAEYRPGDKIAKYGLAALVTGGAAVVAVKTGLFGYLLLFGKKLWLLIVAGIAAVVRFFKRLVHGRDQKPSADQ